VNSPAESLRADLQRIDAALEPFSTPVSDERPGLRWMAEVLRARRGHVLKNLGEAETSRLEVVVTTAGADFGLVALAAVLDALQQALFTAGGVGEDAEDVLRRAVTFEPVGLEVAPSAQDGQPTWTLQLRRAGGSHAAQPVDADGGLLVDAALRDMIAAVEDGTAEQLAAVVRRHGLALWLRAIPVTGDENTATLDQERAGARRDAQS
jgi:hypothetical protein